jgi:hypothetical protein
VVSGLLLRGLLAGILAGVLAAGFSFRASAFETAMEQAAEQPAQPEIVSRSVQRGAGLLTAYIVYGAAVGGLFSLVFALAYGRVNGFGPMILAATLASPFAARLGHWNGALVSAAVFVAVAGIAALALPPVDEVPVNFPASVLWNFRLASIGARAVLWAALGLAFGGMTQIWLRRGKPGRA